MSKNLNVLRKVSLRSRLRALSRRGDQQAIDALRDFDAFYDHTMTIYRMNVTAEEESQTPIIDALQRFLEWLHESGLLEILLKLFFGVVMGGDVSQLATDPCCLITPDQLVVLVDACSKPATT